MLDPNSQAKQSLRWRLCRGIKLGVFYGQFRVGAKEGSRRPRATVHFAYEDDLLNQPLHYVCLGPKMGDVWAFRRFKENNEARLSELTDARRAECLQSIVGWSLANATAVPTMELESGPGAGPGRSSFVQADNFTATNVDGWTMLHCCAQSNSSITMRVVLECLPKFELNVRDVAIAEDTRGLTPVCVALQRGHLSIASELLQVMGDGSLTSKHAALGGAFREQLDLVEQLLSRCLQRLIDAAPRRFARWMAQGTTVTDVIGELDAQLGDLQNATSALQSGNRVNRQAEAVPVTDVLGDLVAQLDTLQHETGLSNRQAAEAVLRHHNFDLSSAINAVRRVMALVGQEGEQACIDAECGMWCVCAEMGAELGAGWWRSGWISDSLSLSLSRNQERLCLRLCLRLSQGFSQRPSPSFASLCLSMSAVLVVRHPMHTSGSLLSLHIHPRLTDAGWRPWIPMGVMFRAGRHNLCTDSVLFGRAERNAAAVRIHWLGSSG